MKPQPKPVTGAIFGFFFGVVIVALLWQLGILPPDRLVVFGIVAIVMMVSTFALTQRVSLVHKRFVVVVVFAALLGGIALTGIPEFVSGGSINDGCTIEASSSLSGETGPAQTSATSPFKAALSDDVPWVFATGPVLSTGTNAAGLMVAGFQIPTWTGTFENTAAVNEITGIASVQGLQDELKAETGLALTGVYHLYGYVHAPEENCDANGYVLVAPTSAFGNTVLIGLWVLALILFIVIVSLAIGVRRSIRTSERLAATMPPADAAAATTTTNAPVVVAEPATLPASEPVEPQATEPSAEPAPPVAPAPIPPSDPTEAPDAATPPSGDAPNPSPEEPDHQI